MTFLSDNTLKNIYPDVDNSQRTPNGIDLRIDSLWKITDDLEDMGVILDKKIFPSLEKVNWTQKTVNGKNYDKLLVMEPKTAYRVKVMDQTRIPADKIENYWIRSSFGTCGISLSAGVGDAGYNGNLEFTLINNTEKPFNTMRGTRFAQVIVAYLDKRSDSCYDGDFQNNKHGDIR